MGRPLLIKLLALGAIAVALGLVLARIGHLVDERQARQQEAVASVERSHAAAQTVLGPLLSRACKEEWDVDSGEGPARRRTTERREFRLQSAPATLTVEGALAPEARYRGLFKVNGYDARLTIDAAWDEFSALQPVRQHEGSRLACEPVVLMVAVADPRGLRSARLAGGGVALPVRPGTRNAIHGRGLHAVLPDAVLASAPWRATLTVELVGTQAFAVVPAAAQTVLTLTSAWPHPSFGGQFLPNSRTVGDAGFEARWAVSALATSAAVDALDGVGLCPSAKGGPCLDTLAVSLIDPVTPYVLSDRAVKYGLLFVLLTLAAVMLAEVLAGLRVHPVQYALVGLALSVFFLLLLSLSEHVDFAWAYAAASVACVALLTQYGVHMLGGVRRGIAFGAGVAILYAALYVLLRMEQTALVLGSLLLFGALAAVMVLTRRVDWYRLEARAAPEAGSAASR